MAWDDDIRTCDLCLYLKSEHCGWIPPREELEDA